MAGVPAAHIAVSFSKDPLDQFFASKGDFKILNDNKDVLLFDNIGNPNFISLQDRLKKLELTLIDPEQEFEKRYFRLGTKEVLSQSLPNEPLPNEILDSEVRKQLEKLPVVAQKARESLTRAGTGFFWITYGLGNYFDSWAGPKRYWLSRTKVDITASKARQLTLTFVPSPNELHDRRDVSVFPKIDYGGFEVICEGRSKEIVITDQGIECTSDRDWETSLRS